MKSHIYFPLSFIKIKGTKLFKEIAALGRICENGFISRETQTLLTTSPYCSSVLEQPGPTMAVFEILNGTYGICACMYCQIWARQNTKIGA